MRVSNRGALSGQARGGRRRQKRKEGKAQGQKRLRKRKKKSKAETIVVPDGIVVDCEMAGATTLVQAYLRAIVACPAGSGLATEVVERAFVTRCLDWEHRNRARRNKRFTPARASVQPHRHNVLRAKQGAHRI